MSAGALIWQLFMLVVIIIWRKYLETADAGQARTSLMVVVAIGVISLVMGLSISIAMAK